MKKLNKKQLAINKKCINKENDKAEFVAKIRYLIDAHCGQGTSKLIPDQILENTYRHRILAYKVINKNENLIDIKSIRNVQRSLDFLLADKKIVLDYGTQMSVNEYSTVGFTFMRLLLFIIGIKKEEEWATEVANRAGEFTGKDFAKIGLLAVKDITDRIAYHISDYETNYFWTLIGMEQVVGKNSFLNTIKLHLVQPKIKYFKTVEGNRPAFGVTSVSNESGLIEGVIKPSLLGVRSKDAETPVNVYIQNHAKQRLKERIDCLKPKYLMPMLHLSLLEPKVIPTAKNRALIELRLLNTKVGYLVAEYIDGAVLIHTFLFITNNGTPEGIKLYELTGLGKLDKKYLNLDKLSTFIKSDIAQNNELRSILKDAGCECLLNMEASVIEVAANHAYNSNTERILNYLKKGTETIEMDEDETVD